MCVMGRLEGDQLAADYGDDRFGGLALLDEDDVAVMDVVVDHVPFGSKPCIQSLPRAPSRRRLQGWRRQGRVWNSGRGRRSRKRSSRGGTDSVGSTGLRPRALPLPHGPRRSTQRPPLRRRQPLQLRQVGQGGVPVGPAHLPARGQGGAYRRAFRATEEAAAQVRSELRTGNPGGLAAARRAPGHTRDRATDRGGNAAGGTARAALGWGILRVWSRVSGCHGFGGHERRWPLGNRAWTCPSTRNWGQLCHSPVMIRQGSGLGQGGS